MFLPISVAESAKRRNGSNTARWKSFGLDRVRRRHVTELSLQVKGWNSGKPFPGSEISFDGRGTLVTAPELPSESPRELVCEIEQRDSGRKKGEGPLDSVSYLNPN